MFYLYEHGIKWDSILWLCKRYNIKWLCKLTSMKAMETVIIRVKRKSSIMNLGNERPRNNEPSEK